MLGAENTDARIVGDAQLPDVVVAAAYGTHLLGGRLHGGKQRQALGFRVVTQLFEGAANRAGRLAEVRLQLGVQDVPGTVRGGHSATIHNTPVHSVSARAEARSARRTLGSRVRFGPLSISHVGFL